MDDDVPSTDQLAAELRELRDENERLRARLDGLVWRLDLDEQGAGEPAPASGRDGSSRRDLLKLAGAGVAGAVGATLLTAAPASATTGTMQYGASNNAGTDKTDLTSGSTSYVLGIHSTNATTNGAALLVDDANGAGALFDGVDIILNNTTGRGAGLNVSQSGLGPAIEAATGPASLNPAIAGLGFNGAGVSGSSYHGPGVQATDSANGSGNALTATIRTATNASTAARVTTAGTGDGLDVSITNGLSSATAVFATSVASAPTVWAQQNSGTTAAAIYGDCSLSGGPGVWGVTGGTGVAGVHGQSLEGPGVLGECLESDNSSHAVQGVTVGTGAGVFGQINNPSSDFAAVTGVTNGSGSAVGGVATGSGPALAGLVYGGTGPGIQAQILNKTSAQPGLDASTNGTGPAVQGKASGSGIGLNGASTNGRGAVLSGGAAPAQLVPSSTATTHPTSGQTGDLFVDKTARLWFCTAGGTTATWKQVQVA